VAVRPGIAGAADVGRLTREVVPALVWVLSWRPARPRLCLPRPARTPRPARLPIETRRPLMAVLSREAVPRWLREAVLTTVTVLTLLSRRSRVTAGLAAAGTVHAMKPIGRVSHGGTELVARNRSVPGGYAGCARRRVVPGIGRYVKTIVLAERSLTSKALRTRELWPSGRTVEETWLAGRRGGPRSGRRAVARPRRALIAAVWRVDQAAWREDGRRREYPVTVIGWLAPASRWPPSLTFGRPPRAGLRPAVTRPWRAGAAADIRSVVGNGAVWARTSLAWRNRPGLELPVTELSRRNWPGVHPAGHVLAGTVLIRRNRS